MRDRITLLHCSATTLVILIIACFGAGCSDASGSSGQATNPYAAEFSEGMSSARTDFVRQVLEDGKIEESELHEAGQKVRQCIESEGISSVLYEVDEMGIPTFPTYSDITEWQLDYVQDCREQWMTPIDSLYYNMTVNPNNENFSDLVAACLVRKGLVDDPGFDGASYDALWEPYTRSQGTGDVFFTEDDIESMPVLPGGVRMDHPDAFQCTMTPLL